MKFRTEIPVPQLPFRISYQDPILLLGSCFSDRIGTFLVNHNFLALSNPFGTLFNPVSIANVVKMTMNQELFTENYRYFYDNRFLSFAHAGSFSHDDENLFLQKIYQQFNDTIAFLEKARFLFITFGTAYCYQFSERNLVVANCHKIPNHQFHKSLIHVDEIVSIYGDIFQKLLSMNPSLKIIFTVSPVRHLGDGFHENQVSKSILHLAIEKILNNENIFYFPAYEILIDDLRDYRFYAEDLCHPGENAIRYMEEIFADTFFSKTTQEKLKEIAKENKFLNHRKLK